MMTTSIYQSGTNDGTLIGVNEGTVIIGSSVDPLDQACLQDLRTTDPRDDKERLKNTGGGLLEASYRWIRDDQTFKQWQGVQSNTAPIIWIRGGPGKGKTMLLCGIVEDLAKFHADSTISFFFCQATDMRINTAISVLRGLIYLLVDQNRSLLRHVRARYDSAPKDLFTDVNAWHALVSIFRQILEDKSLENVYLGIDAPDECQTGGEDLLNLIIETSKANRNIKWLVTSRNEPEITEILSTSTRVAPISLEQSEISVSEGINTFVQHRVALLAQRKGFKPEVRDEVHDYLVLKSQGTFLWVALVLKNLAQTKPRHVRQKLKTIPPGLDAFYHRMMDQVRESDDATFCMQTLATISTVYRPVTLGELGSLLIGRMDGIDDIDSISGVIDSCRSFLTVQNDTVTLVHQSAKDFLDKKMPTEILPKGVESEHQGIFSQCLDTLIKTLRRDIFGARLPGMTKDEMKAPSPNPLASAEYACVYWVDHLEHSKSKDTQRLSLSNREMLIIFLRQKYLNWLEALGILGKVPDGIGAMGKLESILEEEDESYDLIESIRDATRFIQYSRRGIEISPLQVYCSSLIFSPMKSLTRESFQNQREGWVINDPVAENHWSASLHTLELSFGEVDWIAWSPDGKKLSVGFEMNETVQIWDPIKGQMISEIKGKSHDRHTLYDPRSIFARPRVWSPDGSRLAVASETDMIRIWDPSIDHIVTLLMIDMGKILSISWLPDGSQLASGSSDNMVRIWDPTTGQNISTLKGLSGKFPSVAWSPQGDRLASASYDHTIKIWDRTTNHEILSLDGNFAEVRLIAWSPDGNQLAASLFDGVVLVWNLITNQIVEIIEGKRYYMIPRSPITWSPDGGCLAFLSTSYVHIWDRATNQSNSTSMLSSGRIWSIAWSPDGSQLATGDWHRTIQIWNRATENVVSTLEEYSHQVSSIAWSPDGTRLASGSEDGTVRIWDPAILHSSLFLDRHKYRIMQMQWSPDGSRLASGSHDGELWIWDPVTGQNIFTLEGHKGMVISLAWSPNGSQIALGSSSGLLRIWHVATGRCVSTYHCTVEKWIGSIAWSPDGSQLAIGVSKDDQVRVCDSASDQVISILEIPCARLLTSSRSLTWSPDGRKLASGSSDWTVRIWDLMTGDIQFTLYGHNDDVISVSWSADGTRIASGSIDETVHIWNPATGQKLFALHVSLTEFLEFDKFDSSLLHTNIGILNIGSMNLETTSMTGNSINALRPSGYGLSADGTWITYNGAKLIWLPLDYRCSHGNESAFAIHRATMAIASSSNRVIFLVLSEDCHVPDF